MTSSAPTSPSRSLAEGVAASLTLLIAVPLVFLFARALADAEVRRRELPARQVLGDSTYEALTTRQQTPLHYLGNEFTAPDFELKDQFGKPWKLSDQRGKIVVMNFWSITCAPCVEEMPSLVNFARVARERDDIEFVTVTTDASWSVVRSLFQSQDDLPVLFDPTKSVTLGRYGTKMLPETWVIDPRGVIRFRYDGAQNWDEPLLLELIESFH